jgi:hypothetical protein
MVWATIREWRQTIFSGVIVIIFAGLFFIEATWNPIVANVDSHCKFTNWIISTSKWNAGDAIINCLLDDGRPITLNQPAGWQPPEIDSEMKIGVLKRRYFGESFYLK